MDAKYTYGITSTALQYAGSLLLIPAIVIYLGPKEVGLWYLYLALISFGMLLDLGLQVSFTRIFSLAYSGAKDINKEGLGDVTPGKGPNFELLNNLVACAKSIYLILSGLLFFLLIVLGFTYIKSLVALENMDPMSVYSSWIIFSFYLPIHLYSQWLVPLLQAANKFEASFKYNIVYRLSNVALTLGMLFLGAGLVACVAGLLLSLILARTYANKHLKGQYSDSALNRKEIMTLVLKIAPNSLRVALGSLGQFLVLRFTQFLVTLFFGLQAAGSYGLTLQVFLALWHVSKITYHIKLPQIVGLRLRKEKSTMFKSVNKATLIYVIGFFSGTLFLYFFGNTLLQSVGAKTELASSIFWILSLLIFFEGNTSNYQLMITTGNHIPYIKAYILSGIIYACLAYYVAASGFSLLYVLLSQGLVQCAFNYWYWPLYFYRSVDK
jgi:O-antigen/teichoic acid export membrane protein